MHRVAAAAEQDCNVVCAHSSPKLQLQRVCSWSVTIVELHYKKFAHDVATDVIFRSFGKHKRAGRVGSMFCCLQQLMPGRLVSTAEESRRCLSRPTQKKCSNMGLISISGAASKLLSQTYVMCCRQNLVSGVLCDIRCTSACLKIDAVFHTRGSCPAEFDDLPPLAANPLSPDGDDVPSLAVVMLAAMSSATLAMSSSLSCLKGRGMF